MTNLQLRSARLEDIPAIADLQRIPAYRAFVANWSAEEPGMAVREAESDRLSGWARSGCLYGSCGGPITGVFTGVAAPRNWVIV